MTTTTNTKASAHAVRVFLAMLSYQVDSRVEAAESGELDYELAGHTPDDMTVVEALAEELSGALASRCEREGIEDSDSIYEEDATETWQGTLDGLNLTLIAEGIADTLNIAYQGEHELEEKELLLQALESASDLAGAHADGLLEERKQHLARIFVKAPDAGRAWLLAVGQCVLFAETTPHRQTEEAILLDALRTCCTNLHLDALLLLRALRMSDTLSKSAITDAGMYEQVLFDVLKTAPEGAEYDALRSLSALAKPRTMPLN